MSDSGAAPKRTLWDKYVERMTAPNPYPIIETGIPMRDGLELAASISLPHRSERPAPVIVTLTPYDKSNFLGPGTEAEFYQRHGYVFVLVDCRGRGKSDGEWAPFVHDANDGHDVIEWVAAQPWCTGKVGITGLSYDAWAGWAAASSRPEHLVCMISSAAPSVATHERHFVRGSGNRRNPIGPDPFGRQVAAAGQPINSPDLCYEQIDLPCLHVNGWYDLECLNGGVHHYRQMIARSPAADRQRLIVGPWSHQQTRRPHHSHGGVFFGAAAAPDLNHVHRRWFEYWLMGVENGAMAETPVQLFEPGSNRWIEADRWPLASTEVTLSLGFGSDRGCFASDDDANVSSLEPFDLARYPIVDPPLDQRQWEARADVRTWTSEPLSQELAISGWPVVEVTMSSDADDTTLLVMLTDVGPDGASHRVAHGRLLVSPEPPCPPGALPIDLGPAQHCFAAGHRLRVAVAVGCPARASFGTEAPESPVDVGVIRGGRLRLPVTRGGL